MKFADVRTHLRKVSKMNFSSFSLLIRLPQFSIEEIVDFTELFQVLTTERTKEQSEVFFPALDKDDYFFNTLSLYHLKKNAGKSYATCSKDQGLDHIKGMTDAPTC